MARKRLTLGEEELWPGTDYPHSLGDVGAIHHPWDLDEDYAEELSKEIQEQLAKKRTPGFQAVWDE